MARRVKYWMVPRIFQKIFLFTGREPAGKLNSYTSRRPGLV